MDEMLELSLTDLAGRLRAREISAVDLMEAVLKAALEALG